MVQQQLEWSALVQTGAASFRKVAVEAESMREAIDRAAEFGVVTSCAPVGDRRATQRVAA